MESDDDMHDANDRESPDDDYYSRESDPDDADDNYGFAAADDDGDAAGGASVPRLQECYSILDQDEISARQEEDIARISAVLSSNNQAMGNHDREAVIQNANEVPPDQRQILEALNVVEQDSVVIAESYCSLFSSMRSALAEATESSIDHMHCFNDAAGCLQESALDAATKGNRFINSCLRLNQELKGIEHLAIQLKILRRNVDALESTATRLLRFP